MRILNTSRRFGGVDTKLKTKEKLKRVLVIAILLVGAYLVCKWIYNLFDDTLNGMIVDWIDRNFVDHETMSIRWWWVKRVLFRWFIILVFAWVLSTWIFAILYEARQEKKKIKELGNMIADYMHHDREAAEVFPKEYAVIATTMADTKAQMGRQEQIMKDEAAKKNDLITYLAHDLKTPLTSVVGYLSLLEEAPDMPPEQKAKYVHIALEKALRLEKLINEFFEITRYNLQQIVLEKENVDLSFLLIQLTDEFYPILNEKGNSIRLEIRAEGNQSGAGGREEGSRNETRINVVADGEKLARVFNNVLKNAVAYSYPGTEIVVNCSVEEGNVVVRISNFGKTIPKQKLQSIFEKFFRLDDARESNKGGAGLGLAIAKEIVRLHGGEIWADSENEKTTFTVSLPGQD